MGLLRQGMSAKKGFFESLGLSEEEEAQLREGSYKEPLPPPPPKPSREELRARLKSKLRGGSGKQVKASMADFSSLGIPGTLPELKAQLKLYGTLELAMEAWNIPQDQKELLGNTLQAVLRGH